MLWQMSHPVQLLGLVPRLDLDGVVGDDGGSFPIDIGFVHGPVHILLEVGKLIKKSCDLGIGRFLLSLG